MFVLLTRVSFVPVLEPASFMRPVLPSTLTLLKMTDIVNADSADKRVKCFTSEGAFTRRLPQASNVDLPISGLRCGLSEQCH